MATKRGRDYLDENFHLSEQLQRGELKNPLGALLVMIMNLSVVVYRIHRDRYPHQYKDKE